MYGLIRFRSIVSIVSIVFLILWGKAFPLTSTARAFSAHLCLPFNRPR